MRYFREFHDGWFQGVRIGEERSHLFLATETKERFVMVAEGVQALAVDGLKAGNIILEVVTREDEEILPGYIKQLYGTPSTSEGKLQEEAMALKARQNKWSLLEINPSYGATCLALASSIRLFAYNEWLEKYDGT